LSKHYTQLIIEDAHNVREIRLNQPGTINALTNEMLRELFYALGDVERQPQIRAVILSGSGRGFCSGQNLKEVAARDEAMDIGEHVAQYYNPLILRLYHLSKPTVCRIQGACAGAGMSLALACDFRVGSVDAKFCQAFVKIGLVPDSGSTYFLARLIGLAKAMEMALLGDAMDAPEALRLGLLNAMPEPEDLETATMDMAVRLAAGPPLTVAMIKRALHRGIEQPLADQLIFEQYLQQAAAATEDHHRGIAAFLRKETPEFIGK
jgi:2-(1,2-epoxy-1,2-dihydrophenyl)acetyl-CoA isomerase